MTIDLPFPLSRRSAPTLVAAAAGAALAVAAALVAPSTELLPGPGTTSSKVVAALILFGAFVAGLRLGAVGVFVLVPLVVLEGAIRKWLVNDITAFMLKDFLALGIYAAVLPKLRRPDWSRPWWVVVPLAGLVALAAAYVVRAPSLSQGVVGLRSYLIYVPLLWVAPLALRGRERHFLVGLLLIGIVEAALAGVQAVAGPGALNKGVSGVQTAYILVEGGAYVRPSGTFMQVGVLAAFALFPLLAALSLLVTSRGGRSVVLALATLGALVVVVVFTGARSLLGSVALLFPVTLAVLLVTRRYHRAVAVPLAVAAGAAAVFGVGPLSELVIGGERLERTRSVQQGREVELEVDPSADPRAVGSYLRRAAGVEESALGPEAGSGALRHRFERQAELIGEQRVLGAGTGTMTLGAEYVRPGWTPAGEGQYTKIASELGLPGLALFAWFVVALLVATTQGMRRAADERRAVAVLAAGAVSLLSLWMSVTFVLDYPVVAILFYVVTGYAATVAADAGAAGGTAHEWNRENAKRGSHDGDVAAPRDVAA